MTRTRILFIAEAVTLAHVARPAVLASSLDQQDFEIFFASADRYRSLLQALPVPVRSIQSIPESQFLANLSKGKPLHDTATLRAYVEEDLQLLRELRPDVVVGDLRHSLGVSARVAGVPYITIMSAYWSPYAHQKFTVPEIPLTRLIGVPVANALFQLARKTSFAAHCAPMNQVRREHGMPPVGSDIRVMYSDADQVVYPDAPEFVPTTALPSNHYYIGPLLWSPSIPLPDWWSQLPEDRPVVYLTLGSSGSPKLLERCLASLANEPLTVVAAAAGGSPSVIPPNARVAKYLPGMEAAQRASLVICNGGSATAHQALAMGKPVLGLPSNMDQHLNMSYVAEAGAGITIRAEHVSLSAVRDAVRLILSDSTYDENAAALQKAFAAHDPAREFLQVLNLARYKASS